MPRRGLQIHSNYEHRCWERARVGGVYSVAAVKNRPNQPYRCHRATRERGTSEWSGPATLTAAARPVSPSQTAKGEPQKRNPFADPDPPQVPQSLLASRSPICYGRDDTFPILRLCSGRREVHNLTAVDRSRWPRPLELAAARRADRARFLQGEAWA